MELPTIESTQAPLATDFESQTCGRCGGGGHYSYCQTYGTTCFQCRGKGRVYTKRGQAAIEWARTQRTVPIAEVQVGWLLYVGTDVFGGYKAGWYPVLSVRQDGSKYCHKINDVEVWTPYTFLETRVMSQGLCEDSTVQAVPNKARLTEIRAEAIAYQERLTQAGKERKR